MAVESLQARIVDAISLESDSMDLNAVLHQTALQNGLGMGAFLALQRLGFWINQAIAKQPDALDGIWHRLVDSLAGQCAGESEQAWGAYHVGYVCIGIGLVESAVSWLSRCLDLARFDGLRFYCLLELEIAYRGSYSDKGIQVSEQQVQVAYRLGNPDYVAAALFRLANSLGMQSYVTMQQQVATDLKELSGNVSLVAPEVSEPEVSELKVVAEVYQVSSYSYHFIKVLSHTLQGMMSFKLEEHGEAYKEFLEALKHLRGFPDINVQIKRFKTLQDDGGVESCPVKASFSIEIGILLNNMLKRIRTWLGLEPTDDEVSLDRYLSAQGGVTIWKYVGTGSSEVQKLRMVIGKCLERNLLDEAEAYSAQLLELAVGEFSMYKTVAAKCLMTLANICYRHHQVDFHKHAGAFQIIDSFLNEAQELVLSLDPSLYLEALRQRAAYVFAFWQGQPQAVLESTAKPLCHFLEMEKRIGLSSEHRMQLLEKSAEFFPTIQRAYLQLRQTKVALVWAERERARDLLRRITEQNMESAYQVSDLARFDVDDESGWEDIKSVCQDATTVFLVFTQAKDNVFCYFLHADEEPQVLLALVSDLKVFDTTRAGQSRHLLKLLYQVFILPWESNLERIRPRRLVIVPSGGLSLLPFAALEKTDHELEDTGEYLVQRYELVVCPSLRMFKFCEQRRLALLRQNGMKVGLVVGNPTGELAYAQEEAELVKGFLVTAGLEVRHLEKGEATKEAFLEGLALCDWVHLSTHGAVTSEFPRGAVFLANDEKDNGLGSLTMVNALSGRSIEGMLNAEIVVLSACESGLAEISAEGMLGLPRSFHTAGVPTCVASLWPVNDDSTQVLMCKFYESLQRGNEVCKAMQDAMKFMIECPGDGEFGEPKYDIKDWAAFFVSGAPDVKLC